MRLIDADELSKWISGQSKSPSCPKDESSFGLRIMKYIDRMPSVQTEIIHCKDCRYFKSTTSIHGECECGEMWQSLFGETTEVEAINVHKDHYCRYAERKTDEYIN